MPGTAYFQDKVKNSLNSFSNGENAAHWKPDQKYDMEKEDTIARVGDDLESGILTKFRVLRTRQLEQMAAQNCYSNKNYTFMEAEQCEKFMYENDFKLGMIKNFYKDHISKHVLSHSTCLHAAKAMDSVADKDKAFADCHNTWVRDFKENQSQDLEARARSLIGRGLE